jgi:hypothetical protein
VLWPCEPLLPEAVWPEVPFWPHWLLPVAAVPWFELVVLESPDELIVDEPVLLFGVACEPVLLFGVACAVPLELTPDELMVPLALVPVSPALVVPLAVALLFGLLAAVPAVDGVPSTDPCCVVPVLLAVFVSLFEPEHAAIRAAAAIAVPT